MNESEAERLLLQLVVQLTIAPHAFKDSDAWKDALDYLDPDELEVAAIEAAEVGDFFGDDD